MKKKVFATGLIFLMFFGLAQGASAQVYVEKGDTLYKIAQKSNMNLQDLIDLNPHIPDPNKIKPNDYIIIRSGVETKKDMVDYARSLQDVTAYKYGGNEFPYFTDCSGWAQGIFKKFNVNLPRTSREQARTGTPVKFRDLRIGDLMFFSTRPDKVITHTGIYLGNDYWISNLNERKDVEILSTWGTWTQDNFLWGARHEM